jgi:hypothetical protein
MGWNVQLKLNVAVIRHLIETDVHALQQCRQCIRRQRAALICLLGQYRLFRMGYAGKTWLR